MAADRAGPRRWPRRALNTAQLATLAAVERRIPFWPRQRIERLQRWRLRSIVRHAYETVPYYRETMDALGLRPGDVRTAADLARLPHVEGERYEIIDGELHVSTQPRFEHQYACSQLVGALVIWSERTGRGIPIIAPGLVFAPDQGPLWLRLRGPEGAKEVARAMLGR